MTEKQDQKSHQEQPDNILGWVQDKIAEYIKEYRAGGLLSKQTLTPEQLRVLPYDILNIPKLDDRLKDPQNQLYRELEFFLSNDPSGQTKSLFQRLDTTHTVSGSVYLANHLLNRSDDLETLHYRQNTAAYFADLGETEAKRLEAILTGFKESEPDLYWMITKKSPEMTEVLNILFFNQPWSKFLNTNDQITCLYYYFIMIFNPIWGIFGPILIFFIPYIFTRFIMKIEIPLDFYIQSLKSTLFGDQFFKMFKMAKQVYVGVTSSTAGLNADGGASIKSFVINKIFDIVCSDFGRWAYLAIVLGCYLWSIYNQCLATYNYNKLINFIHAKLNRVHQLITSVNAAIQIAGFAKSKSGRHLATCPVYLDLQNRCLALLNDNPVIRYIREQETFIRDPSILSNKGAIIKAYYLLDKDPTILRPFIEYMAYLDTWMSVARLSATWCMPVFQPIAERPTLLINGCFSPVCQPCVANDVALTGQNMLLTGPNGSGKSTFLKNVMSAVVLAQTIGLAPAAEMQFTPFTYLSTYLNIPDCQGRESLFQAEMTRCHDHLAMLKQLEAQPGKFSLNIMDEIFVSTNYLEGMSGAYAVIKSLGGLQNSLHIITTHFDKLTDDAQPIPGYMYKYFTITMGDDEEIQKDYKLRDGVNRKHMALHLLKLRGFDHQLVESARAMYDQLIAADQATPAPVTTSHMPAEELPTEQENSQPVITEPVDTKEESAPTVEEKEKADPESEKNNVQ